MITITSPTTAFAEGVSRASTLATGTSRIPASIRHHGEGLEVIAMTGRLPAAEHPAWIGISLAGMAAPRPPEHGEGLLAALEVGTGSRLGRIRGWLRESSQRPWRRADLLSLPGPGMLQVPIDPHLPEGDGPWVQWTILPGPQGAGKAGTDATAPPEVDRSRTRAALGHRVVRQLAGSRIGFAGLGRMNSLLLEELARFGCGRFVTVDPDPLEAHNAAESSIYRPNDRGAKVEVAGVHLERSVPGLEYVGVAESVTHVRALDALSGCDVIVVGADSPHGWVVPGVLGACFQRLVLGVGTQVHRPGTSTPPDAQASVMGFDVRLLYPGDGACLLCFGGVGQAREQLAAELIRNPDREAAFFRGRDWRAERPGGSLRSLNLVAAGLALRLLEDAFIGRIERSTWIQGDFDSTGAIRLRRRTPAPRPRDSATQCACRTAGSGWAGIPRVGDLLRGRAAARPEPD